MGLSQAEDSLLFRCRVGMLEEHSDQLESIRLCSRRAADFWIHAIELAP